MHLEVLVGAVAKKLRAARPEVGEPGDVLLGHFTNYTIHRTASTVHHSTAMIAPVVS
jgi:hypothetical protein